MNTIRLIAFDLDGTLLKDNKELTPRTLKALRKAAEAGISLVPTTGRLYDGVPEEIRTLPFIRYVIGANGAQVYDAREKRTIHRAEMNREEIQRFFDASQNAAAITGCYKNGKAYMGRADMDKMEAYSPGNGLFRMMRRIYLPVEDLKAFLLESEETVQKLMLFFADLEERRRVLAHMEEALSDLSVSSSVINNIEVNTGEANKGAALKFLGEYLGIKREETAAFGDGSNDITMLMEAGTGFAMKNACQEAKEAADKITLSNEEEGVAFEIERMLQEI